VVPAGRRLRGPREVLAQIDVAPAAWLMQTVDGVDLRVSSRAFFQSGVDAASLLLARVRAAAGSLLHGGAVVDAFGGVGLFSAGLGLDAPVVVESSEVACADARLNLRDHGATIVEAMWEDWAATPAGLVIADPARAGLGRRGVAVAAATGAERVVLVSCDPVAGARDGALLVEHGFVPAGASVVDLFPQTHHVEVVARYDRGASENLESW
jgi:23S rRNA (uracil1939-C5)-methyltransferase